MLSKKIEGVLNEQVTKEAYAAQVYLSMAVWGAHEGLPGCAAFLFEQSQEERGHMLKIIKYVLEVGGEAVIAGVEEPPQTFKSIKEIFETALEHELGVTKSIHHILDLAQTNKDHATCSFLQWFVNEQVEEEKLFTTLLDMVKLAGTDSRGLFLIDREINKMRDEEK